MKNRYYLQLQGTTLDGFQTKREATERANELQERHAWHADLGWTPPVYDIVDASTVSPSLRYQWEYCQTERERR